MTDGFVAQRQKESILTLRRESGLKPEDYPRGFLELFARLFRYTERGQPADVGDSALLSDTEFLPDENIRGIGYVEPQGLPGDAGQWRRHELYRWRGRSSSDRR